MPQNETEKNEVHYLKVKLDGEIVSEFESVKKQLGLKNDAEVVRFLIKSFTKEVGIA